MQFFEVKDSQIHNGFETVRLIKPLTNAEDCRLYFGVFDRIKERFTAGSKESPDPDIACVVVVGYGPNVYSRLFRNKKNALFLLGPGEGFLHGDNYYSWDGHELTNTVRDNA